LRDVLGFADRLLLSRKPWIVPIRGSTRC